MSRKNKRKSTLQRATPSMSGGALMYLSPQQISSLYGQQFYGSQNKNLPKGSTALFPSGDPLPPQPNVNPQGLPIQFKFPISYNTFPVDRSLQQPDIPSFEQLRRLAKLDWGIGLCERKLLRMVLALKLKIKLTDAAVAGGAEEQDYQDEIKQFTAFFSKPDPQHDVNIHEWIQRSIIEQTQIDELYLYKHRTRGGKLLGLWVTDGSQMKPLLDDWGHPPQDFAYQQYPWGIPGMKYSMDQMIHRRETPASDTPYGRSCVERVMGITNLALRKLKQDMAHYTEGNIPAGILTPPESSNWTPDLIDAYEQSWNALIAGNPQQQTRIRVTQPGFSYTPFVQPSLNADIDRFWLNIRASAYSIPMEALNFTETSNRSTGEIQKDTLYEQALYPYVAVYAAILTDILQNDFEPSLHGDLFEVQFGGYEPPENEQAKAATLSTYVTAGILGLSNAGKLAGLPEDPDAPHIGRVQLTATGPIFLDDMASDELRKAATQAKLAGFQMATNPPQPQEQEGDGAPPRQPGEKGVPSKNENKGDAKNVASASKDTKSEKGSEGNHGGGNSQNATRSTEGGVIRPSAAGDHPDVKADYKRWRTRAIEDVREGKAQRPFFTKTIPYPVHDYISQLLRACGTPDEVRTVFARAQAQESELVGGQSQLEYNPDLDIYEPWDTEEQLKAMRDEGTAYLRWGTGVSQTGVCPVCGKNDGVVVEIGQRFPSSHRLPGCHPGCQCSVDRLDKDKKVMQ